MAWRPDLFQPRPGMRHRALSASTAWIFTGGDGILEGWCTMLRLADGGRQGRREGGIKRGVDGWKESWREGWSEGGWVMKEQGAFCDLGTPRTWHSQCRMRKIYK